MLGAIEKLGTRLKNRLSPEKVGTGEKPKTAVEKLKALQDEVSEASREAQKKQYDENMARYKRKAQEAEAIEKKEA